MGTGGTTPYMLLCVVFARRVVASLRMRRRLSAPVRPGLLLGNGAKRNYVGGLYDRHSLFMSRDLPGPMVGMAVQLIAGF